MSITTPGLTNFTAGELSPRISGRVDVGKYFNGCRRLENFLVHPHGGVERRPGLRFVAQSLNHAAPSLLIPFEFSTEQTYLLELGERDGEGRMRVFTHGGMVAYSEGSAHGTPGEVVEVATPYRADDLQELGWVQSNNLMILTHPAHPPHQLVRKDHDGWELTPMEFVSPPEDWKAADAETGAPASYPRLGCFFEKRLCLAATPEKPNTLWFSRSGDYRDFREKTREVPYDDWGNFVIWTLTADSGNLRSGTDGQILRLFMGEKFEIEDAVRGEAEENGEVVPRYYRYKGMFRCMAHDAPKKVTFKDVPDYDALQIDSVHLADGSLNAAFWEEFSVGDIIDAPPGKEPLADDAITLTLEADQSNDIRYLVPRGKLVIGTSGGEWVLGSATATEPFSPASTKAERQDTRGSARARPEPVGAGVLYIQRSGRKVREIAYRFESDAFVSRDMTVLSEHVTGPGVCQAVYVQEPDSVVWFLRTDGTLCSLTYMPDQEVLAWARHQTSGRVERIASIFSHHEGRDVLWAVVRRTVNGSVRRFVERMDAMFSGRDQRAGFFLDCGLSTPAASVTEIDTSTVAPRITAPGHDLLPGDVFMVSGSGTRFDDRVQTVLSVSGDDILLDGLVMPHDGGDSESSGVVVPPEGAVVRARVEQLGGLEHLAGETVQLVVDGAVCTPRTVGLDGTLALDRPAFSVHAGLGYSSVLEPMPLEGGSQRGVSQTKKKRITHVGVRFRNTLGGRVGTSEQNAETVSFRTTSSGMDAPPRLWSGDRVVRLPGGWEQGGALRIEQDQPLPMTVLLLVPSMVINE